MSTLSSWSQAVSTYIPSLFTVSSIIENNGKNNGNTVGIIIFVGTAVATSIAINLTPVVPKLVGVPSHDESTGLLSGARQIINERFSKRLLKEKGPLVQCEIFGRRILFIADKYAARVALRDVVGKGYPFHNLTPKIVPYSIFSIDTGSEWTKRRSAFRKAFSTSCLKAHMTTVKKLTDRLVEYLEQHLSTGIKQEIVHIDNVFVQLTIGTICEVAFEMNVHAFDATLSYGEKLHKTMKDLGKLVWVRFLPFANYLYNVPIFPFKGYKAARNKYLDGMRSILSHMQNLRKEGKLSADSLAMAVLNYADMPGVDEAAVLVEIGTFFIAGMDTTAHTLSFFIYCLARYPDIQQRCQQEIDKHLAAFDGDISRSASSLPAYVEATLKESMRKYPTAAPGSIREVKQEEGIQLTDKIHLPKGWWIAVNLLSLHNYEGNWGPNAEQFIPERWLDSQQQQQQCNDEIDPLEVSDKHSKTSTNTSAPANNPLSSAAAFAGVGQTHNELIFAPFSYGMRNCIGMNLALMELRVSIISLLSKFTFRLADESMLNEDNLLETPFVMKPQKGLPIYIEQRK